MLYVISFDLNNPNKDYRPLYNALREFTPDVHQGLPNLWFIRTNRSSIDIANLLLLHIDGASDKFFIGDVTAKPKNGWMFGKTWDWVNAHDS